VIYVAGGKMRGDFTAVSDGQEMQSHMITDGQTAYIWTNQMPQGVKMSFGTIDDDQSGAANSNPIDPDKELDYRCSGWTTDQSQFNLPSGVTFTDLSAALGASAGAGSAQCAQCSFITDPSAKAQCLASLNCN
jgi:hypothetical protein